MTRHSSRRETARTVTRKILYGKALFQREYHKKNIGKETDLKKSEQKN